MINEDEYMNLDDQERPDPDDEDQQNETSHIMRYEPGFSRRSWFYHKSKKIENLDDKISYFENILLKYRQGYRSPLEPYDEYDFEKCIILEIEYLEKGKKKKEILPPQSIIVQKYIIRNNDKIQSIFDISNNDIFECTYLNFIQYISAANFDEKIIKRQNLFQDLIFRLSGVMGGEWYTEICKNMKWNKSIVSGHKSKLEYDLLIKKIDRILPRPPKSVKMQ